MVYIGQPNFRESPGYGKINHITNNASLLLKKFAMCIKASDSLGIKKHLQRITHHKVNCKVSMIMQKH